MKLRNHCFVKEKQEVKKKKKKLALDTMILNTRNFFKDSHID